MLSGGERKQKQQRKWKQEQEQEQEQRKQEQRKQEQRKQEQRKQEQRKQGLSCMRFKTQVHLGISRRRISIKHLGQSPLPPGEG